MSIHHGSLSRVGRGEQPASKRWVHWVDDADHARAELVAGTTGVDVAAGKLHLRVGGLPLVRRWSDGSRRQVVRAVLDWPHPPATLSALLRSGETVEDEQTIEARAGHNRILLYAVATGSPRPVTVLLRDGQRDVLHADLELPPEREWTVFLVHHSHLDIGYTDPQWKVLQSHRSYLDQVLDLAAATEGWPEDSRFRWNLEANMPLRQWMRARPRSDRDAFFDLVRNGRVEVTALPFTMHTEACSVDELAHALRFADELRRTEGIPMTTAMQTDVPGATKALAQLLVDAGISYFSVSHNYAGRSVPHHVGGQDLTRPFYWQTPAGDRLLTWFGDTPHGMAYMEGSILGFSDGYDQALVYLPEYLASLAGRPYPYASALSAWWRVPSGEVLTKQPYPYDILHLRVLGQYSDNAGPSAAAAEIVRRWNEDWEYPRLRMAINRDFFQAVEERVADRIDTFRGDWTDWWADGLGSAARLVAVGRQAQAAVRGVQTLHSIADHLGADAGDDAGDDAGAGVDQVYDQLLLFDEHTWGAAEPWEDTLDEWYSGPLQWQTKSGYVTDAYAGAVRLQESGLARLVSRMSGSRRDEPVVLVFNPTGQPRTEIVRVFVPGSRFEHRNGIRLVDAQSGETAPSVIGESDHERDRHRALGRDVTFLAAGVPPFGYRTYALVEAAGTPEPIGTAPPAGDALVLENAFYRVVYDPPEGRITSLTDTRSGAELVAGDAIFGFGQYVHDRYTTAPAFNHLSSKVEAHGLELLGERAVSRHAAVLGRATTPLWERLTVRMAAPGTDWLDATITLPHGIDRVDLEYRLAKPARDSKESGYVAFPFRAATSGLRYEITGGVDGPGADRVPGAATHMRAIRHWASLDTVDAPGIAWATRDAPLLQVGNLYLPYAPFPATLAPEADDQTTLFSWLFNNVWDTNFPSSQQGEMCFRYAVSTAEPGSGEVAGRRLGEALAMPLLAWVAPALRAQTPPTGSFCGVDSAEAEILALRRPRRGRGLAVLLRSCASGSLTVTLTMPTIHIRHAWVGDHLENRLEPAPVSGHTVRATLRPGALATVVLEPVTASGG